MQEKLVTMCYDLLISDYYRILAPHTSCLPMSEDYRLRELRTLVRDYMSDIMSA